MKPLYTMSLFLSLALIFAGCVTPRIPVTQPTKTILPQHVPANLQGASKSLNWLMVVGVAGLGIGVAAYFIIPGDHKAACGVIFGSLAMGGTALIVQTSLPFLPYVFGAIALMGLVYLALKVFRKPVAGAEGKA